MIKGSFFVETQNKVTKLRWNKSLRVTVVDVGVEMDISKWQPSSECMTPT